MSLAPTKGTCDGRNGRYNSCGATDVWIGCKSRGQCTKCSIEYKKRQKKGNRPTNDSEKRKVLARLDFIQESQQYYLRAIVANQKKNEGKCLCDECEHLIPHPKGAHVCHIVGSGANKKLYLEPTNHVIIGKGFTGECNCGAKFDDEGKKSTMKIYPLYLRVREELNYKYYNRNK